MKALTAPAMSIAIMDVFYKKRLRFSTCGYIIVKDIHTEFENCKNCGMEASGVAERTKLWIADTMKRLLAKKPLEKIRPVR